MSRKNNRNHRKFVDSFITQSKKVPYTRGGRRIY